ncbi:hypothetical protein JTE90_017769 [Oedothorax gibbosus]|uniref:Uncharacterized protein n=1 Tax=Oedothorax gibbosus TaxID=931172 RepID=A0AAV6UL90_9ARAC|nr:hypothetical protein JTE90_017769 [Oedothorax gibbosus]
MLRRPHEKHPCPGPRKAFWVHQRPKKGSPEKAHPSSHCSIPTPEAIFCLVLEALASIVVIPPADSPGCQARGSKVLFRTFVLFVCLSRSFAAKFAN